MLTRAGANRLLLEDEMSNKEKSGEQKTKSSTGIKRARLSPTWTEVEAGRQLKDHGPPPISLSTGARPKTIVRPKDIRPVSLDLGTDSEGENVISSPYSFPKLSKLGAVGGKEISSSGRRHLPKFPPHDIDRPVKDKDKGGRRYRYEAASQDLRLNSGSLRPKNAKPIAMPDFYHGRGKVTLDSWMVHFAIVAEINGWEEEEQAKYMALSLRDEALTAFTESLSGNGLPSVDEIVEILRENFDRPDSIATNRQKFQSRRRNTGESLTVLRHHLIKLAREAYPQATPVMIDDLVKDQFIVALDSQHLRMQVRREKPRNLEEAFKIATEEEKLWKEEESQFTHRRNSLVTATEEPNDPERSRIQRLEAQVQQLTQLVKELATNIPSRNQRENFQPNRKPRGNFQSNVKCYGCGRVGHYKRDCPKPASTSPFAYQTYESKNRENY